MKKTYLFIIAGIIGFLSLMSCVYNEDYSTPPIPPEGFFKETFANTTKADGTDITSSPWPKIADVLNFDNGAPVAYTDPTGRADVRLLSGVKCVWFPTSTTLSASLIINNIPTEKHSNTTLRYRFNAGVYNAGETSNANKLIVKCNDVEITLPDILMDTSNSKNEFIVVKVLIPDGTTKIEFLGIPGNNRYGFRIKDIELIEDYPWQGQ
jgi:hypothetical protein